MENAIKHRINDGDNSKDETVASIFDNKFFIPLDFEILESGLPFYQYGLSSWSTNELTCADYSVGRGASRKAWLRDRAFSRWWKREKPSIWTWFREIHRWCEAGISNFMIVNRKFFVRELPNFSPCVGLRDAWIVITKMFWHHGPRNQCSDLFCHRLPFLGSIEIMEQCATVVSKWEPTESWRPSLMSRSSNYSWSNFLGFWKHLREKSSTRKLIF